MAAQVGLVRQFEALKRGLPDRHGYDGLGWSEHIEGAAGEYALAKHFNVSWNGSVNTFRTQADVQQFEIRTRSKHEYELLVRPNDPDDAAFILITGKAPDFRIQGWMLGKDAKQVHWKQTHGYRPPAYFVPHSALHDIEALRCGKCECGGLQTVTA